LWVTQGPLEATLGPRFKLVARKHTLRLAQAWPLFLLSLCILLLTVCQQCNQDMLRLPGPATWCPRKYGRNIAALLLERLRCCSLGLVVDLLRAPLDPYHIHLVLTEKTAYCRHCTYLVVAGSVRHGRSAGMDASLVEDKFGAAFLSLSSDVFGTVKK